LFLALQASPGGIPRIVMVGASTALDISLDISFRAR
jgi:hypothetical protein